MSFEAEFWLEVAAIALLLVVGMIAGAVSDYRQRRAIRRILDNPRSE